MSNETYYTNYQLRESDVENLFLNGDTLFQCYRPGSKIVIPKIVGIHLKDASLKLEFSHKNPEILYFPNTKTAETYERRLSRILEMVHFS